MDVFQAVILGLIQGLTEFLPVSSSGHFVIAQYFFDIKEDQVLFNVILHLGTLIPVFIIFWDDIKPLILFKNEKRTEMYYILIAVIPTAVIGLVFDDFFQKLYSNLYFTVLMLIITGVILFISEKMNNGNKEITDLKSWHSSLVGVVQGGAIIPGISRSGSTIAASLFLGLNRKAAAKFSFLISIPVISGAGLLQFLNILETGNTNLELKIMILGFLTAAISGYIAIKIVLKTLVEKKLNYFSYYCWSIALIIIFKGFLT